MDASVNEATHQPCIKYIKSGISPAFEALDRSINIYRQATMKAFKNEEMIFVCRETAGTTNSSRLEKMDDCDRLKQGVEDVVRSVSAS